MLFVPATPGSQLCKQVREGIKDMRCPDGGLTKVVEAGGASILAGLGRSDPFRVLECPFEEVCWVKGGVDCWRTRVVYRVVCLTCGAGYTGTTGGSLHKRVREHMAAFRKRDCRNAVGKHFHNQHPGLDLGGGEGPAFEVEIL